MSLSTEELDMLRDMSTKLSRLAGWHGKMERYYEGSSRLRQLGVAIPPELARINTVTDWPSIAVDALEERLDWLGWAGGDDLGLAEVYVNSQLDAESGMVHLDSLIFGTGFVGVHSPTKGMVRVVAQSPKNATCLVATDGRSLRAGLVRQPLGYGPNLAELFLPNEIVRVESVGRTWRETDRVQHSAGRVPMVPFRNRRRASRRPRQPAVAPRRGRSRYRRGGS